jgi:hypothetical protein
MSHKQSILEAFHQNGGSMTLGYILTHPWGYEFRARATELRRQGFVITCEKGKRPSDNVYRLVPSQPSFLEVA